MLKWWGKYGILRYINKYRYEDIKKLTGMKKIFERFFGVKNSSAENETIAEKNVTAEQFEKALKDLDTIRFKMVLGEVCSYSKLDLDVIFDYIQQGGNLNLAIPEEVRVGDIYDDAYSIVNVRPLDIARRISPDLASLLEEHGARPQSYFDELKRAEDAKFKASAEAARKEQQIINEAVIRESITAFRKK